MYYILIETAVLTFLVLFVWMMLYVSRHWIWPTQTEQPPPYVGALISASGTIFAASIAWVIADHSIEFQKTVAGEQAVRLATEQRQKLKSEVTGINDGWQQLSDYLDRATKCYEEAGINNSGTFKEGCFGLFPATPTVQRQSLFNDISTFHYVDVGNDYKRNALNADLIADRIKRLKALHARIQSEVESQRKRLD